MSEKKGILNNWIVRNLLIAFAVVVALIAGAMIFLNVATQHNKELSVPDLATDLLISSKSFKSSIKCSFLI